MEELGNTSDNTNQIHPTVPYCDLTTLYQIGWEFVLRWIVFYVFYPVTVPGMVLLSACGLYPCGAWVGMEGDDEEEDENYAKGMQLLEYIGINPWILSLITVTTEC